MNNNLSKRETNIDTLRGIALIGVILVNVNLMNSPPWAYNKGYLFANTVLDKQVENLIFLLISNKAFSIFAFLFGYSAAIFLEKSRDNHIPIRIWYQSSFLLLLIGMINVILF